jgi:hypothetical protein
MIIFIATLLIISPKHCLQNSNLFDNQKTINQYSSYKKTKILSFYASHCYYFHKTKIQTISELNKKFSIYLPISS